MRRQFHFALGLSLGLMTQACKKPGQSKGDLADANALLTEQLSIGPRTTGDGLTSTSTQVNVNAQGRNLDKTVGVSNAAVGVGKISVGNSLGLVDTTSTGKKIDPTTLHLSTLNVEEQIVPNPDPNIKDKNAKLRKLLLHISLLSDADYYKYYICSVPDPGDCNPTALAPKGFMLDTHVIQNAPKGEIRVVVSPCVNPQRSLDANKNCGAEKVTVFQQSNF